MLRTVPAGWSRPAAYNALEFALFSTQPSDAGTGGVECTGASYAPVALTPADANVSLTNDLAANVADVRFPLLTGSITVNAWVLRTTAGTILWAQPAAGLPLFGLCDPTADTFTRTAHGVITGQAVRFAALDSVVPLPGGLAAATTYYAAAVDANTLKFYDTQAHAFAGGATGLVDITSAGACALRAWYGGTFNLNDRPVIPAGQFQFYLPQPLN